MKPVETSEKPLKQNPFTTYRDPVTGLWMVDKGNKQKPELAVV